MRWKRRGHDRTEFGCAYCADDQNRWFGHVTQIGSSDERGTLLLRCPRCSSLYEVQNVDDTCVRLSVNDAEVRFPGISLG